MADRVAAMRSEPDPDREDAILRRYGFAIPTDAALDEIAVRSPGGVVELGRRRIGPAQADLSNQRDSYGTK